MRGSLPLRPVRPIPARDGMTALVRTPVLPEATSVGALSAQLRHPRRDSQCPLVDSGNKGIAAISGSRSGRAPARHSLKFTGEGLPRCGGERDIGRWHFLRQAARHSGSLIASLLVGVAVGMTYRFLFDPSVERALANFLRSGLQGAGVAFAVLAVQMGSALGARSRLG
jgi:hypothetical protein